MTDNKKLFCINLSVSYYGISVSCHRHNADGLLGESIVCFPLQLCKNTVDTLNNFYVSSLIKLLLKYTHVVCCNKHHFILTNPKVTDKE